MKNIRESAADGRVYRGESAAQRREERFERLLDAALEIIGTEGFKAATVRAVCGRAELTQRYYYESFENAEDMFIALYERELQRLAAAITAAVESAPKDPPSFARAAVGSVFRHLREHPQAARTLFLEVYGISPAVDATYRGGSQRMIDLVVGYARPLVEPERLNGLDFDLQGSALVGAVIFVAMNWILSDFAKPEQVIVENLMVMARSLLDGLGRA